MKKSKSIMVLVGPIREAIENDLTGYEEGQREHFRFLNYVEGDGMYVPLNWIDRFPEWEDQWNTFMNGQTMCGHGFFHRDVRHFLSKLENDANKGASRCQ